MDKEQAPKPQKITLKAFKFENQDVKNLAAKYLVK